MLLRCKVLVGVVAASGFAPILVAQSGATVSMDATALVRRAVQHRLDADKNHRPMRYLLHVKDERHETTKQIVETNDGDVARLIATGGQPLSPEADRAELARLDYLAAHPELQEHRKKSEQKDQARVDRLMGMLPDALVFHLEGMEPCPSAAAMRCYKLSYAPNPKWRPPDLEARFLRGVAGTVWIDEKQERLTRLDASFIADVDFGFGLLGKVGKGGTVTLEQTDVGGDEWELTSLKVNVSGEVLVVKSMRFEISEEATGFAPVAPMGYREAIELLKKGTAGGPQR